MTRAELFFDVKGAWPEIPLSCTARCEGLEEALARARWDLLKEEESGDWHLARLHPGTLPRWIQETGQG